MNSRKKGSRFELWCVAWFAQLTYQGRALFNDVHRGIQTRGAEAADVVLKDFWIECKRGRRPNIRRAYQQALDDSQGEGKIPIVISKADNDHRLVTMGLDDFQEFLIRYVTHNEADE